MPTLTYPHEATTCEATAAGGACIALAYYGDGCELVTACGGETESTVYFRTTDDCRTEVFLAGFCGSAVLDWNRCAWATPADDRCSLPHPTTGPAVCNCPC